MLQASEVAVKVGITGEVEPGRCEARMCFSGKGVPRAGVHLKLKEENPRKPH